MHTPTHQQLQQHPYALVAVRRTLLLDGGPAIAAAFAALFAPPTTKQPDGPPDVPSPALRLAIHLATLSVIFSPIQTEEGENGHSPERPAFATAALPLLPTHIDLPPSSATTPCWLDRLTTAVLTHRGSSVLLPSSSPPDACDGWEWSGDGMARALRALGRAAAMREQACDLQPLHALYAAGGAPALLDCLLVDVDGEVVEGVAAAAAEAAAAIPPPSATGNGSGRKRNREEQEEKEGKIEGGWSMQDVTAALRAAELNSRARGVITGCAMCAQEEGQGQGGNLLRCARCKAARYCSRGRYAWDICVCFGVCRGESNTMSSTSWLFSHTDTNRVPGAPLEGPPPDLRPRQQAATAAAVSIIGFVGMVDWDRASVV